MAEERRQTTWSVAWFWDLHKRELLDLDPPYQRRSVWSQSYKDYFIDTLLLGYPAPAVFLYEDIDEDGVTQYSVVDGKQRLSTIFEFLGNLFPVSDAATVERFRGLTFVDFPLDAKKKFYEYQFAIEFLPSIDEGLLSNIFDRINRNVAKLTPQELRHARFSGEFATKVDLLTVHLDEVLPKDFPRVAAASKRQMKDSEFVAQLLLLLERGVESYSQDDLDRAYSDRDEEWPEGTEVETEVRKTVATLQSWAEDILASDARRLRNQADFYSLFGAVHELSTQGQLPTKKQALDRLDEAMKLVNSEDARQNAEGAKRYYEAARSASNDVAQRRLRIAYLKHVLTGGDPSAGA